MNLSESHSIIVKELLDVEHRAIAQQLKLVPDSITIIDRSLLIRSIGMIDNLSRIDDERARKIVVTLSAIIWTYRVEEWDGLKDFLILILSRIGFPPSAIMIDKEYDYLSSSFSGLMSFVNELNITIHQLTHEIFIKEAKFLVTGFQKRVWDKLTQLKLLGISAPTSAGKSYIILLKTIDFILKKKGNIIYIVPTLSLVAQVSSDFNLLLKKFQINDYRIATTFSLHDADSYKIYVLTQEKAISAFSQSDTPFQNVRVLIVDEIQNIEKVANEDDQRAKILYDTLIEFRHACHPDLTIISGPRIEGLRQLGIDIFNEKDSEEEKTKDSPVASFTYAISKSGNKYFFNQYTDLLKQHNRIAIIENSIIKEYGGSRYKQSFISYLSSFIDNLGKDSRNIIFSPTSTQARKTALQLSELREPVFKRERVNTLINYLKETVHEQYDMCECIPRGFVYHHGKTPAHVRSVIERAIREKLVPNVVCTTTLMQGVNLPAQNVILRNPDLAITSRNGIKPKLTDYEIANLRGRAGRLLKDFIGRTYILEEDSFEREDSQIELFPEAEKQLRSGYGEKYEQHKLKIDKDLEKNISPNDDNNEYAFLLTYIRQIILKHTDQSEQRLKAVGINLEPSFIKDINDALATLIIPNEVCFKNRYWDPIDLNELFRKESSFFIPTSISDQKIELSLEIILDRMNKEFPTYYKKYFNVDINLLRSACISAKEWMKEKTLKAILSTPYFDTPEKVEARISLLQNYISYGLPMLLKPLYDIKDSNNMFLRFIEIGAYNPITRKMIELNIPRETAIFLNQNYFTDIRNQDDHLEDLIVRQLNRVKDSIDYWRRIQIEGII